ncbi:MAG: hypothetical protein MUC69_06565 [Gemmatimonadales bacterium]|nr:hypothetical protein [Gemmatimonadales bacterium]
MHSARGLAALAALLLAAPLAAQETGTPVFKAPYRAFDKMEFGATLSDPERADIAIEGQYSFGFGVHDFGLRGGWADTGAGDAFLAGGSFRSRVITNSKSFPLDGAVTAGFGTQLGDGPDAFFVPVGLSLGRRVELEGSKISFVPYVHPVVVPTFWAGDNAPDGGVDFAVGLGVDIRFGGNIDVRVSGGIGDLGGVAIGVVWVH